MMFYKIVTDGYITVIGTGNGGQIISKEEYESILEVIQSKPTPDSGYDYRLKEDLTWELYEIPPEDETDEISDSEALAIIRGETV